MASIWQLTVIAFPRKTIVLGVVLNRNTSTSKGSSSFVKSALAIASSYFRETCGIAKLKISMGDQQLTTETDRRGSFFFETDHAFDESHNLELSFKGKPLLFEPDHVNIHRLRETGTLVISDIDDTVLVSYTNKTLKRLITTLFRSYTRRKPVDETCQIFDTLGRHQNDHVYVSRSEYNLFPMLSNFIKHHDLPSGPLLLTPFLSLWELVRNKKDTDFKVKTINFLLDHSNHERVVLIGDDTQHDLQVYAKIAKTYGSRIHKIFIRQTDPGVDKRESPGWSQLVENIENMVYYNDETNLNNL